jgi:hypothetical protein
MRMHLPKPRAPFSKAVQVTSACSQVIRGRYADLGSVPSVAVHVRVR